MHGGWIRAPHSFFELHWHLNFHLVCYIRRPKQQKSLHSGWNLLKSLFLLRMKNALRREAQAFQWPCGRKYVYGGRLWEIYSFTLFPVLSLSLLPSPTPCLWLRMWSLLSELTALAALFHRDGLDILLKPWAQINSSFYELPWLLYFYHSERKSLRLNLVPESRLLLWRPWSCSMGKECGRFGNIELGKWFDAVSRVQWSILTGT